MVDLGRNATAISLSDELVGALVVDPVSGNSVAQVYDRAAQAWLSTGEPADSLAVVGTTLAFMSSEADAGGEEKSTEQSE